MMNPREDLTEVQLRMEEDLKPHGFFIEFEYHSTMFRKDMSDGNHILISDTSGVSLPEGFLQEITVGVYDHDGVHIFYRQYYNGIRGFLDEIEDKTIAFGDN